MKETVQTALERLQTHIENEQYRGWDPFDGLNSRLFQRLPLLKNNKWVRLAWLQFFKRSPVNFRPWTGVPKVYNAKGLALILSGYYFLYQKTGNASCREKANALARQLLDMSSPGYAGACWGYPFDWQARAFFQPKGTPTVVATSFVAHALLRAFELTGEKIYLETASDAQHFILRDLNKTCDPEGDYTLSYSPLDHTQVFNAGLLGAKTLSLIAAQTGEKHLLEEARKIIRFAVKHQRPDGAWPYGTLPYHQWVDSFHTGFNLEAIHIYRKISGDNTFDEAFNKGMRYYLQHFFTSEGIPKYYDNRIYPVDMHAPAQLFVTLAETELLDSHRDLVNRVLHWSIRHMQSKSGYFYYQKRKYLTNKIPYMRWTQAWMFYGLTRLL